MGDCVKVDLLHPHFEKTTICGWDQVLDLMLRSKEIENEDEDVKLKFPYMKYPYIYRGAKDSNWKLPTALERTYAESSFLLEGEPRSIEQYEAVLLRNFKKYSRIHYNWLGMNFIDEMIIAQHHGLPTRLLDWTGSALVALALATKEAKDENGKDTDGVVWRLHHDKLREEKLKRKSSFLYKDVKRAPARSFTSEMLVTKYRDPRALQRAKALLLTLDPPMLDQRIVNQASIFTMVTGPMVPQRIMRKCKTVVKCWCKVGEHYRWACRNPALFKLYIIDHAAKREIRQILQLLNITHRMLFPGLDGVADTLVDRYRASER